MKAFIAGASGYTGRALVEVLREHSHEVVAHLRPDSSQREALSAHFSAAGALIDLSPWDEAAMTQALREHAPDVVYCLIGTTRARMKDLGARGEDPQAASYEAVDYGLTALLARASVASQVEPVFVYLSAMGAGPNAAGAYMQARWRAEQAVRDSGLAHVIVRPGLITGEDRPEARPMEQLAGKLTGPLFGALDALGASRLARRYRPTDAQELARALARLGAAPPARAATIEAEDLKDDTPHTP